MASDAARVAKLEGHLELLRSQHRKLQLRNTELEQAAAISSAATGGAARDHLLTCLRRTVADLFCQPKFSDIVIVAGGKEFPAHKVVLASRGSWNQTELENSSELQFEISAETASNLLRWVYTETIEEGSPEGTDVNAILDLLKASVKHDLPSLLAKCEQLLMPAVSISNCISILIVANEMEAAELRAFTIDMAMERWDDINPADFSLLDANLLHDMLKSKTKFPLHRSIKLQREDVMFMFTLDYGAQLSTKINEVDENGDSPLHLALLVENEGMATSVVQQGGNVNAEREGGLRLLHAAIQRLDSFAACFLIENRAQVNLLTPESETALHFAAKYDLVEVAQKLIEHSADLNPRNNDGNTPIQVAVVCGHREMVDLFLGTPGIDVNTRNKAGHTALWLALGLPEQDIAQKLVDRGCDINLCTASGDSMLHYAVGTENEKAALFLIEHGAQTNLSNDRRETPLHIAAKLGLLNVMGALLGQQAGVNSQDQDLRTPLMLTILHKHEKAVDLMLQQSRLEINLTSSSGDCALGIALATGQLDVAQSLLNRGADIDAANDGVTLLHQNLIPGANPSPALFLLDRGANPSATTPSGDTAIVLAVKSGLDPVVKKLCELRVDVNKPNAEGTSPLWIALELKHEVCAKILVDCGADVNFTSAAGHPAIHLAIDAEDAFAANFLIKNGANVNIPDSDVKNKDSPLHAAAEHGLVAVLIELMKAGADVNQKNTKSETPVHRAVQSKQLESLKAMLRHQKINLKIQNSEGMMPFGLAIMLDLLDFGMAMKAKDPKVVDQANSKGYTMLHTAVERADAKSVALLLKCGVDVNKPTSDAAARTPLSLAVERGDEGIVASLLKAGANHATPDRQSKWTVAHVAATVGFVPILKMLIKVKANMNAVDDLGETVLHAAVRAGHVGVVKLLLDTKMVNPEAVNIDQQTPLHILARYPKESAIEMVKVLYPYVKGKINPQDVQGRTPLWYAVQNESVRLCKTLVSNGAHLGMPDNDGKSCHDIKTDDKSLILRLLNAITVEPAWIETKFCQGPSCSSGAKGGRQKFGTSNRKHHCRHCGICVCKKCSSDSVPISKFNLNKPQRVCEPCFLVLTNAVDLKEKPEKRKQQKRPSKTGGPGPGELDMRGSASQPRKDQPVGDGAGVTPGGGAGEDSRHTSTNDGHNPSFGNRPTTGGDSGLKSGQPGPASEGGGPPWTSGGGDGRPNPFQGGQGKQFPSSHSGGSGGSPFPPAGSRGANPFPPTGSGVPNPFPPAHASSQVGPSARTGGPNPFPPATKPNPFAKPTGGGGGSRPPWAGDARQGSVPSWAGGGQQ